MEKNSFLSESRRKTHQKTKKHNIKVKKYNFEKKLFP